MAALAAAQAARQSAPDLGALSALERGRGAAGGRGGAGAADGAADQDDAFLAAFGGRGQVAPKDGGALTPLVFAVRANDLESVKVLLAAGADVNQVTGYGWSPLLVATQNRYYKLGAYLLELSLIHI